MQNIITKLIVVVLLWGTSLTANAKIYAVVVGVEKYDGTVTNLSAAVDDAQKVYNYLKASKQNKVVFLKDKQATKQNILYAMQKVYSMAGKNDMILFYFSGHGAVGMFCPTNVKGGKMGLLHTEVKAMFKKSKARNKLCIADACYSGSISTKSQASEATSNVPTKENVVIFMSSRATETSLESYIANAGIFTQYFIKGMRGAADFNKDKAISLFELYVYVRKQVRRATKKHQTPIMYGHFNKNAIIANY